jgi:hypothetical protein
LSLAALFLLADAVQPDYGAACLQAQDGILLTRSTRQTYLSADGGRTWDVTTQYSLPDCYGSALDGPIELTAPDGTRYRVDPGVAVERSTAAGGWETVYSEKTISEPERVYNLRTISSSLAFQSSPLDALIDPAGSSLVMAMGVEGVLIIPPAGEPIWSAVGVYRHNNLRGAGLSGYLVILGGELWLSAGVALAWLATAALRLRPRSATWQIVLTVLGWLLLAAAGITQHPDINTGYLATFAALGLLLACAWALVLVVIALIRLRGSLLRAFAPRVLFAPLVFIVFLLPYIAWAAGLLPSYWLALTAAALLALGMGVLVVRLTPPVS